MGAMRGTQVTIKAEAHNGAIRYRAELRCRTSGMLFCVSPAAGSRGQLKQYIADWKRGIDISPQPR